MTLIDKIVKDLEATAEEAMRLIKKEIPKGSTIHLRKSHWLGRGREFLVVGHCAGVPLRLRLQEVVGRTQTFGVFGRDEITLISKPEEEPFVV